MVTRRRCPSQIITVTPNLQSDHGQNLSFRATGRHTTNWKRTGNCDLWEQRGRGRGRRSGCGKDGQATKRHEMGCVCACRHGVKGWR
ncbi:uncharacterized protein LOC119579275 isoform X2 [Penaeus monodon]|uniref:uncharacterized protein LOC119579275 isoform X2 n=1 Tax=Penaeus monodon TaxID=6687 RepID=UPI0018A70942|nr:uncharacterized protein LOC119579275 isoform X2 [Penaeus monodon]XP_037782947.1 uncharacterized protein LOC119579275 isoform X2 [Penaeus monodon]